MESFLTQIRNQYTSIIPTDLLVANFFFRFVKYCSVINERGFNILKVRKVKYTGYFSKYSFAKFTH